MKCPTCGVEIKDHPPSACLDALFCMEVVMGWENVVWSDEVDTDKHYNPEGYYGDESGSKFKGTIIPNYSTNISHTMKGVEINDCHFNLGFNGKLWVCTIWDKENMELGYDKAKELAISRARILWAMMKGEKQ